MAGAVFLSTPAGSRRGEGGEETPITDSVLRLSVGLEDVEYFIEDLRQAPELLQLIVRLR